MSLLESLATYCRDMAETDEDEANRRLWSQIAKEIGDYLGDPSEIVLPGLS